MKRNILVVTSFSIALIILSCNRVIPKADFINTSVAMTLTVQGWTLTPSSTPTSTCTSTQTITPTITLTPTPAPTRTPTLAPTYDPDRFYAPSKEYSFIPPMGWFPIYDDTDNTEEPVFFGPQMGDYRLNLEIYRDETYYGVFNYAANAKDQLMTLDKSIKEIQEDALITDDGKAYIRWEITSVYEEITYHSIFYFFGEDTSILITLYTRLEDTAPEFDALVDRSMQTIIFHPIPDSGSGIVL